ncbi:hypothetical protein DHEL01_v210456 [Diaporthe helianthi]|uniref:DUF6604 domain-containing protein n=1 Tax=Diaporthe helianthi TaxID=158607 RepID=A0A2P5HLK5_DIAHE|nr:hypothetical protein DHEL01_v210456 [Diaporthe helianthi]
MTSTAAPSPLSLGLLSIYKQYKADTETIAGWLKATAVKHGYKLESQDGWTIRTSDFVPMAKQIVANVKNTSFNLHPPIHRAFRRAIVARKECTKWYEENTNGQYKSNEKHAYFTDILMTAWDILLKAAATRDSLSTAKSATVQQLRRQGSPKVQAETLVPNTAVSSNRFAAFYIDAGGDGDDDDELDVSGAQTPVGAGTFKKGGKSKSSEKELPTTIIADEGQIEEEFWFAIQSFLQEQQRVREEVRRYWEAYRLNESHLVMATFGTRMAIDLIRRSETELDLQVKRPARFPAHKYPVSTLPALLVASKQQGAASSTQIDQPFDAPLEKFVLVSSRQNELTLYNTFSTLKMWSYQLRGIPGYGVSRGLSLDEEVSRLHVKVSKIAELVDYCPPYEDDITRGVKKALKCGEIPIWTTFAMRLLLDMDDILFDCRIIPWMDASDHAFRHADQPPTHWHHEFGRHHVPLADEPLDHDFLKEHFVKHKPSTASQPISMLQKIKTSEGPRKKGMAAKRASKKKPAKAVKEEEEIDSCENYLRCGYDWYEKDVDRALDWVTQIEDGDSCFRHRFDPMKTNPLHCGLMKYDLYRSRHV